MLGEGSIPVAGEVGVAVAVETAVRQRREVDSDLASFLEVADEMQEHIAMWLPWIRRILGQLVDGENNVGSARLSHVIKLTDNLSPNYIPACPCEHVDSPLRLQELF